MAKKLNIKDFSIQSLEKMRDSVSNKTLSYDVHGNSKYIVESMLFNAYKKQIEKSKSILELEFIQSRIRSVFRDCLYQGKSKLYQDKLYFTARDKILAFEEEDRMVFKKSSSYLYSLKY